MSCSVLSTNSLSDIKSYDGNQDSKKARSIQVLNTMMKILSSLSTINSKQIEKSYKMAVEDKRHKLPDNQKYYLFQQLAKIKTIRKILFLQEDQSDTLKSPIALVQNQEEELVLSRWSVDSEDREDLEILSMLMSKEKTRYACVIRLDSEDIRKYESQKPLYQSNEFKKSFYSDASTLSQSNSQYLAERVMQSSRPKGDSLASYIGNTQSHYSPPKTWNSNAGTTSFAMNNQYQSIKKKEVDYAHEKEIRDVLQQLGNTRLHSGGLLQAYGDITYRDLFLRLISEPHSEKNRKWIRLFKDPISDSWNHRCLEILKDYFRNC